MGDKEKPQHDGTGTDWQPDITPSDEELQARALMEERYGRKSEENQEAES